jgi:hypothetical protein
MAPKGKKPSQKGLTGAGFWPMLPKTAVAAGKFCSVPGKFWDGCPSADKEKRYKCIVVEFLAVHDFGGGRKGSAFKVKEMARTYWFRVAAARETEREHTHTGSGWQQLERLRESTHNQHVYTGARDRGQ